MLGGQGRGSGRGERRGGEGEGGGRGGEEEGGDRGRWEGERAAQYLVDVLISGPTPMFQGFGVEDF